MHKTEYIHGSITKPTENWEVYHYFTLINPKTIQQINHGINKTENQFNNLNCLAKAGGINEKLIECKELLLHFY